MQNMNRRTFLRAAALTGTGLLAAACQPKVVEVEKVVTQVVKEEVIVEGTPQIVEKVVEVQAPTAAPKDKVVVRDIVWSATAKTIPMYEMIAQSFTERFPHITIEHLFVPNDQHTPRIQTMIAAGDPPEVASPLGGAIHFFRAPDYSEWLSLDPFVERDNYDLSDFGEVSLSSARNPFTTELEGMPVQLFSGFIAYNKDLFEKAGVPEPPHDWDTDDWDIAKLVELASLLTLDDKGRNANDPAFDKENVVQYGYYESEPESDWGFCWGGHSPRTDVEDRRNVGLDDVFIEGADHWRQMAFEKRIFMPNYEATEFAGVLASPFHTGRLAMVGAYTWNVASYKDIKDFRYDFAAEPHGPVRDRFPFRTCMDQATIFAKSKHNDESWEWLKYISSEDISFRYSVDLRECLPARLSHIPKYGERLKPTMPQDVDVDVVAESLPYGHYSEAWPPPTGWIDDIWNIYNQKVKLNTATAFECYPECRDLIQANWDAYYAQFE